MERSEKRDRSPKKLVGVLVVSQRKWGLHQGGNPWELPPMSEFEPCFHVRRPYSVPSPSPPVGKSTESFSLAQRAKAVDQLEPKRGNHLGS